MKRIIFILIGLLCIFIELSVLNRLYSVNLYINLFFIYSIILCIKLESDIDLIVLTAISLVYDLLIGKFIILSLIFFVSMLYLIKKIIDIFDEKSFFTILFTFLVSSTAYLLYYFVIDALFYQINGIDLLLSNLLIYVGVNTFWGIIFYYTASPFIDRLTRNWW